MLLSNVIPICLICFHLIESYTPAGLRALAAIQTQRARAIANAVNLRARAQYNAALARSRASNPGLLDRRVIRESGRYLEPLQETQYYDNNYYGQGGGQAFAQQEENSGVEGGFRGEGEPQYSCTVEEFEEDINPEELPHISVNFNEEYQQPVYEMPQGSIVGHGNAGGNEVCPVCQSEMGGQQNIAPHQDYYDQRAAKPEAAPHIRPLHSHIHGTLHGGKLIQPPTYTPLSHVVTPNVNLHVAQNQNTAASIQPGHNTHLVNPLPQIHSAGKGLLHHVGVGVNVNPGFVPNIGHGANVVQGQSVETHKVPILPVEGRLPAGTGVGGSSVIQTQNVHQGLRDSEVLEMVGMPNKATEENPNDEKLGTFSPIFMKTPDYNEYSDMTVPQNRQGIVRYLENEHILHQILPYDKIHNAKHILTPSYNAETKPNYDSYNTKLEKTNFDNVKLGTFIVDPSRLEPIPTLPRNFVELDPEHRRQAFMNILNTEQRNFQNMFVPVNSHHDLNNDRVIEVHRLDNSGFVPENNVQDEFQNMETEKHFQTFSQDPHFDESDMDGLDRLGVTHQPQQVKGEHDENVPEMLTKLIENDADTQKKIGMAPQGYPVLGNLFQAPTRRFSEEYFRMARSLNSSKAQDLDQLLVKEKELINSLKKNAKHDEDLMMIGYIGDSLIDDFEKRINNIRKKRDIGRPSLHINRLFMDPKTRLDIPKTLENLGTVTKTAFEHEKAPLYHVRNMMGSAQDAVMATMKIPTTNFLIPSSYQITNTQNDKLGAINPSISQHNPVDGLNQASGDGIVDTFNKVGSAVRESVLSGQEALGHVGQMATHAKSAIHSGRYASPRIILKQIPHITREPTKKAMIITPRIFDIAQDDDKVGSTLGNSQPDFVRLGHIFDAVGLSNPNAKNVEFEKIIIEPKSPLLSHYEAFDSVHPAKMLKSFRNMLEGMTVEKANEEDFVGSALNAIDDVRHTLGADSLRDLIVKMRESMTTSLNSNRHLVKNIGKGLTQTGYQTIKTVPLSSVPNPPNPLPNSPHRDNSRSSRTAENQWPPNQDYLGYSLFPQDLTQPFMGQVSEPLLHQPYQGLHHEEKTSDNTGNEDNHDHHLVNTDKRLGHMLGAINPMMFEKMFNESLSNKNNSDSPHAIFHHHHDGRSHGHHQIEEEEKGNEGRENGDEQLGTGMAITGQMLKPFMGQPSKKMQEDFFGKYKTGGEEIPEFIEFEDVPGGVQWSEVLNPVQEAELEYDE